MRYNFYKTILFGSLLVSLTGCSTIDKHNFVKQRETEYLRSSTAAPLEIPEGLSDTKVGEDYVIPASEPVPTAPVGLLPPSSLAADISTGKVSPSVLKHPYQVQKAVITTAPAVGSDNVIGNAGNVALQLDQPAAASWNSVGVALNRMAYRVVVKDQPLSTFYILDVPATNYRVTHDTAIYQVHLRDNDAGCYVYVTDTKGNAVNPVIAQRILNDTKAGLAGKSASSPSRELAHVQQWFKEAFPIF